MASHLLIADWLNTRVGETPGLIDRGYPVGPHALAAGLSEGLGTGLIEAFAGITLAIPVLTALVAVRGAARPAAACPGDRRGAGGASLSGRGLPGAGGVQGADRGPVPARLRAPLTRRDDRSPRTAAGGDRGGRRLRLQLPGPLLAPRRGGDLRGDRAGTTGSVRWGRARRPSRPSRWRSACSWC